MFFAYAIPGILSRLNKAFGSIFLGMHESRQRRAEQIIREWHCDEQPAARSVK